MDLPIVSQAMQLLYLLFKCIRVDTHNWINIHIYLVFITHGHTFLRVMLLHPSQSMNGPIALLAINLPKVSIIGDPRSS